jgi:hypothetical protein
METIKRLMTATLTALWLFNAAAVAADAPAAGKAAATDTFPTEQIEQLVAPIALYPDALLAQIFMAATYPLDIVQADRWLEDHGELTGEALEKAAAEEDWDPSVQALVFFPEVLGYMSDNLNWTQDLGDAVLAQQKDVTDAVQRLRKEAQAAGTLKSTEQQTVEAKGSTIIVQPAKPDVVYVPSYNPATAYGQSAPPATTYYPATYDTPVYEPQTYAVPAETVATTPSSTTDSLLTFGAGALVGGLLTAAIMWDDNDNDRLWYGGPGYYGGGGYWGGSSYWNNGWNNGAAIDRDININRERNITTGDITVNKGLAGSNIKAGKWEHNPVHRGGVRYKNKDTRAKFDGARRDSRVNRDAARGRNPGKIGDIQRPNAGNRVGDLKRPDGGNKLGDIKRPDAGNKIGDVKRPDGGGKLAKAKRPATRPANIQRPAAKATRPDVAKVQRPAKRDGAKVSGFKPQAGRLDRAASQRGAASRGGGGLAARTGGGAKVFGGRGGARAAGAGGAHAIGGGGGGVRAARAGGGGGRAAGGGGRGGGRRR